jgi:hypothetical protein
MYCYIIIIIIIVLYYYILKKYENKSIENKSIETKSIGTKSIENNVNFKLKPPPSYEDVIKDKNAIKYKLCPFYNT